MENFFTERSAELSQGKEQDYFSEEIQNKYFHKNVFGNSTKYYCIDIIKKQPEFVSVEYDEKISLDENDYLVYRFGKCNKFKITHKALCYGEVSRHGVEYFSEPKSFDVEYILIFTHGKPQIAEINGVFEFILEQDLPRLLENLGLQQKER